MGFGRQHLLTCECMYTHCWSEVIFISMTIVIQGKLLLPFCFENEHPRSSSHLFLSLCCWATVKYSIIHNNYLIPVIVWSRHQHTFPQLKAGSWGDLLHDYWIFNFSALSHYFCSLYCLGVPGKRIVYRRISC